MCTATPRRRESFLVSLVLASQINSICVQRRPGEAVGAICCLRGVAPHPLTVNIEYNQLDPLLRATVSPNGDVAEAGTQFSPFPGNINVLVFSAGMYSEELHKSHGLVPEFINPKFADAAKTRFTSPARLESMMQDFPRLVGPEVTVGVTEFERFISFSAVKNNLKDAEDKWKKTGVAESAATGETDIYYVNRWMLASVPGVEIEVKGEKLAVAGVELEMGARVVLGAQMGVLVSQVRSRFNPRRAPAAVIKISTRSTLVLDGDVTVDELHLDGALVVRAVRGARVRIARLKVVNAGWAVVPLRPGDEKSVTPEVAIRGFRIERKEQRELIFDHPGDYVVSE
jgi:UDP-sugar pyrophosphorylase